MNSKTLRITYWTVTVLFALFILVGAVTELMQTPQSIEALQHLGYPAYLNIILGVAKIAGVIAILQWKYRTVKEWAYAGFTIDILGASASTYFAGDGIVMALFPLIFLVWMFGSYFLWKKSEQKTAEG
ncbi:DoxX family protein [Candidatus Woesearchaeota archaeon]|nr:DoxX family protein [Candidatus Woesearchaeota archaeon]